MWDQPDLNRWTSERDFSPERLGSGVTFRLIERLDTGERWFAPLGTPDPWALDEGVPFRTGTGTTR